MEVFPKTLCSKTDFPNASANGLVDLKIGDNAFAKGKFSEIDWSQGPYFRAKAFVLESMALAVYLSTSVFWPFSAGLKKMRTDIGPIDRRVLFMKHFSTREDPPKEYQR